MKISIYDPVVGAYREVNLTAKQIELYYESALKALKAYENASRAKEE